MKKPSYPSFFTSLLVLLASLPVAAQQAVSGRIADAESREPLAFVNIGVKGKDTGTISHAAGDFLLPVNFKS